MEGSASASAQGKDRLFLFLEDSFYGKPTSGIYGVHWANPEECLVSGTRILVSLRKIRQKRQRNAGDQVCRGRRRVSAICSYVCMSRLRETGSGMSRLAGKAVCREYDNRHCPRVGLGGRELFTAVRYRGVCGLIEEISVWFGA